MFTKGELNNVIRKSGEKNNAGEWSNKLLYD